MAVEFSTLGERAKALLVNVAIFYAAFVMASNQWFDATEFAPPFCGEERPSETPHSPAAASS